MLALDAKINFDDNALFRHTELERAARPRRGGPGRARGQASPTSSTSSSTATSAAWSTAPASRWRRWTSSSSTAASRRTSSTSAAAPPRSRSPRRSRSSSPIPKVKAILVNIFGGIMKCDIIADGRHRRGRRRSASRCRWSCASKARTSSSARRCSPSRGLDDHRRGRHGRRRAEDRRRSQPEGQRSHERSSSTKNTKLIVQGITGSAGHVPRQADASSTARNVVGGVTPGKGGADVRGQVPVFDTVAEAVAEDRRERDR